MGAEQDSEGNMDQERGRFHGSSFTSALHAVAEVDGEVIHNVKQEGEVVHIVHVDLIWVCGDGLQLILIGIFNTYNPQRY